MADIPEIVTVPVQKLYIGRGLRGEPLDDDVAEVSVDLPDLGVELDQALEPFQTYRYYVWLPLTTVVGGVPELVWGDDDSLIPTAVAVPATTIDGFPLTGETTEGDPA